jgi:hypothetical protein
MRVTRYAVGASALCAWGSALAGGVSLLSSVSEVSMEVLGVPLPVVLAAAAGALLARSYAASDVPYMRAIMESLAWTFAGCFSAPAALAAAEKASYTLPTSALAFLAMLVASLGPKLFPVIAEGSTLFLRRWIDKHEERRDPERKDSDAAIK